MSFNEVLAELPAWSLEQRHLLVQRALELDEPGLHDADELLVERRLADHYADRSSSVSAEEMIARLRSSLAK